MQNIAEREIARRQQLCEEEYYDEDEEGDSTASPVLDEREQCGPDFDAPRSRLAEPIVWSSPKYPRKTLPVRTKSLSHRHRQRQNPRHYDAHYYQEDDTPDPYAEFEMPLEMLVPDADSYVAKPLPPVPTRQFRSKTNPLAGVDLEGQSRSRAATVRFQSALEKPGKPYNSSPFAVGANHDRTAVGRRRMPAQSLGIPEEYDD
ncbi:hypothetical protein KEM55_003598 [Ascosphaera atra]|nr:hypothetical protein KEM55_003598 [Ascosphaera atra]